MTTEVHKIILMPPEFFIYKLVQNFHPKSPEQTNSVSSLTHFHLKRKKILWSDKNMQTVSLSFHHNIHYFVGEKPQALIISILFLKVSSFSASKLTLEL